MLCLFVCFLVAWCWRSVSWCWAVMDFVSLHWLEGLERFTDSKKLLTGLLQFLGFLEHELTLGRQERAFNVAECSDDFALELVHLGLQIRLE